MMMTAMNYRKYLNNNKKDFENQPDEIKRANCRASKKIMLINLIRFP